MNYGDLSDGVSSDSCPSEDNLDEKDLAQIMPIVIKKVKTKSKEKDKEKSKKKEEEKEKPKKIKPKRSFKKTVN